MSKRKQYYALLLIPLLALLTLSCSLLEGPADGALLASSLAVDTDLSRSQGIFINEKGAPVDILSYEEEEGRTITCVEAVGLVPLNQASPAMGLKGGNVIEVKALVLGIRDDGKPGVWEIAGDDSVRPVKNWKGKYSSCLPESDDREGGLRGLFGWKYFPIAIRTDGAGTALIVGEAVNDGYKHGRRWGIEKGTTVGVYWKLELGAHKHFVLASPARVIGVGLADAALHHWKSRPPRGKATLVLSSLNLFLLDYYEDYLVDVTVTRETRDDQEAFYWDAKQAVYGVKGKNKNLDAVIASISREDLIAFAADEPPPPPPGDGKYARIVIDTYEPHGGLPNNFVTDTYLSLFDSSGVPLPNGKDDNGNTDKTTDPDTDQADSSRIDYTDGLSPGTYYIKVTIGGSSKTTGNYALRVLALTLSDSIPIPVYPVSVDFSHEADYELLDAPLAEPQFPLSVTPVGIKLGRDDFGRILESAEDVDWIQVELPVIVIPMPK